MKIYPEQHRRIAIFGGRFDPIHNGHLAVATEVLKTKSADEVWLSLENQHQWRPIVASIEDRKAMVELAIGEEQQNYSSSESKGRIEKFSTHDVRSNNKLHIDLTPIELGGMTETIAVVRALRKKYPQNEFVFVVGSDQPFSRWTHWEELEKEVHFLVVARKGSPMTDVPSNATFITDPTYEPLDDSATRIRELRKMGRSITGLVPESVEKYIISHGLYR